MGWQKMCDFGLFTIKAHLEEHWDVERSVNLIMWLALDTLPMVKGLGSEPVAVVWCILCTRNSTMVDYFAALVWHGYRMIGTCNVQSN